MKISRLAVAVAPYVFTTCFFAAAFLTGVVAGLHAGPVPCEVQAHRPLVAAPPVTAPLTADDDRLFQRLKGRIDERVEQRLVESLEDAADPKPRVDGKKGVGGLAIAAAVGKIVFKYVKLAVEGLILTAVVALVWKFWWLIAALFGLLTTVAGWAGAVAGKRAAAGK